MKILRRDIKHGTIAIVPQVLDDFWALYNAIRKGDHVYSWTSREIRSGERYDKPEKGKRISVFLGISVEDILWDKNLSRLRIHGIILDAPEEIGALGSHHTLNVELNKPLTIVKNEWLNYHLDQLDRAARRDIPPIIVIAIDDESYCIALVRSFGLDIKAEERISLPGKQLSDKRTEELQKFFKSAAKTLEEILSQQESPVVVLGLGFVKNHFVKYLEENATKMRDKIVDVKSVNSTGKAGILEAMRSGVLAKALTHAKVSEEAEAVEEVLRRLGKGLATVVYGLADVEKANAMGAIDEVFVTDAMLRESSEEERKNLEKLMREIEERRGKIIIISQEYEAGINLKALGGIAALLRFPVS